MSAGTLVDDDLIAVRNVFGAVGARYWIESGTLLATVRDGRLFAHDRDLDVGIFAEDADALGAIASAFDRLGYRARREYYRGLLFNMTLIPRWSRVRRRIDVYVYRVTGGSAWAPANVPARNAGGGVVGRVGRAATHLAFRAAWARGVNALHIDREPWRRYFMVGTWMTPAELLREVTALPSGLMAPQRIEEYLTYRYGNWRVPQRQWDFWEDDGGIRKLSPAQLDLVTPHRR